MKINFVAIVLIALFIALFSCTGDHSKKTMRILHPNKDSELTLLMREMYDYYDTLKIKINEGEIPSEFRNFAAIHSAAATEPSKSESPLYQAMSKVYLESAERLNDSGNNMPKTFNTMVDNCMNCHQQMCPGPMVKIKKLYIPVPK